MVTVGVVQAFTLTPAAPVGVDVAGGVLIAAQVDDRHLRELLAIDDEPGPIGRFETVHGRRDPLRGRPGCGRTTPDEIGGVAADALVETHEVLRRDHAGPQGAEPVLHTHVVEEPIGLRMPVGIDERAQLRRDVVQQGAADTVRPQAGVIHQRRRETGAAIRRPGGRIEDPGIVGGDERVHPDGAEAGVGLALDRRLLRRTERRAVRRGEVLAREQATILDLELDGDLVLIGAVGLEAVQEPRVRPGDHVLHDRAARASGADGVTNRPVGLGDVLLDHHDGLGRERVIGVRAVVGERRGGDHEPLP